jgi:hypothetical protein
VSGRRPYLRSGIVALAVLVLIAIGISVFTLSPSSSPHSLPGSEVASDLASAIQTQRHLGSPPELRCPPSITLQQGGRFTCTLVQHPHPVIVEVTQTNSQGNFTFHVTDQPAPDGGSPTVPSTPGTDNGAP